jgi:hypothetical protein
MLHAKWTKFLIKIELNFQYNSIVFKNKQLLWRSADHSLFNVFAKYFSPEVLDEPEIELEGDCVFNIVH